MLFNYLGDEAALFCLSSSRNLANGDSGFLRAEKRIKLFKLRKHYHRRKTSLKLILSMLIVYI